MFKYLFIDCLAFLCQKLTMTVLDNKILVVGLLEQLLSMPGGVAIQVLYAILPLTNITNSIRDTLVLVLRKALTTRDIYTRQMAVLGFLQLLKNLKVSSLSALSQGNCSSATSTSTSSVLTEVCKGTFFIIFSHQVSHKIKMNFLLCR